MHEEFIFPPRAASRSPFRLHLAGTSYCDGSYYIDMRAQDTYFVFEYVERGRGHLIVDEGDYFPEAGDVYFVPDHGRRFYRSDSADPWVKHWFNVSGPLVRELLRIYDLEHVHWVRHFSRPELFTEGLSRLRKNPEKAHLPLGPEIICAIVTQMAADVQHSVEAEGPISDEGRLLRDFLEKQIFHPMPDLVTMGKILHRSEVQTIRIFRRDFGETPYQYLLKRKLAAAQELLCSTRRTIKQIAADLHFSNEYYFAGLFKRKVGHAPGQYRRIAATGELHQVDLVETAPGQYVNAIFLHDSGSEAEADEKTSPQLEKESDGTDHKPTTGTGRSGRQPCGKDDGKV